ncbi:MAG: heavy metal-binding domain-containing protein [Proteocatella sp.]
MILTTTNSLEGKEIIEYKGIVFGEVIVGINMFKDIAASVRNIFGGRSESYEKELNGARTNALKELSERAEAIGANAVVGIDVDYEILGADNGMMMVSASGTAVIFK